jgi:hypothetical protein
VVKALCRLGLVPSASTPLAASRHVTSGLWQARLFL